MITKEEFIEHLGLRLPITDLEIHNPDRITPRLILERIPDLREKEVEETLREGWKFLKTKHSAQEEFDWENPKPLVPPTPEEILHFIWQSCYLDPAIQEWVEEREKNPEILIQELRRTGGQEFREALCEYLGYLLITDWNILKKYLPNGILGLSDEDIIQLFKDLEWKSCMVYE